MKRILLSIMLISIVSIFLASWAVSGEEPTLVIWCNSVHQQVAEGTRGGAAINLAADFESKYNIKLQWVTIPWSQMQDKILRQLSVPSSDVDLVFLVQDWATPTVLNMLEPLDPFMKDDAISNFKDLAPGMVAAFRLDGSLRAVPYRSNPQLLHYNKAIFAERGITAAPSTFEELIQDARNATYVRNDGAHVYGLGIKPSEDIIDVVRAYGGEVLTNDYQVKCNEPAAVRAIEALRELYTEGVIPPNFTELGSKDYQSLVSEGLVSMVFFGDNYFLRFNDPAKSKVAGNMWFAPIPASQASGLSITPAKIAYWGVGIPENSPAEKKAMAWKFIKYFTSHDAQLKMALNGNGPVRVSVFGDPTFAAQVPYASADKDVLAVASPLLPVFEGTQEVSDIFQEQATLAILGQKDPQPAMDAAAAAINRVLEREGLK